MSLPTLEAAFAPGGAVFKWPDSTAVIASAARFNAINSALFGFIKQLEEETGFSLASHNARITSAASMLETHAAAIADRYTKAEADAVTDALGDAVTAIDTALQSLTAIVQTDTEAANALAALSAQWDAASNDLKGQITGWLNERYTKTEVQTLLSSKADKASVPTNQDLSDALAAKANTQHNHTLTVGDGSFERFTLGTQERLNIKAGTGLKAAFNATQKTVELSADVQSDIDAAVEALKGGVTTDGNTLAKLRSMIGAIQTALQSDDASLDTIQELVSRIKTDGDLITSLTSGKADKATVIELGGDLSGSANLSAAKNTITAKIAAKVWDANK